MEMKKSGPKGALGNKSSECSRIMSPSEHLNGSFIPAQRRIIPLQ